MGMHEAAIPPDPGKPSAEYVLKFLSHGLELEHKLTDLCDNAESVLSLTPLEQNARTMDSIQLSSDEKKLIDYASANLSYKHSELVQHLEENDGSFSPLDLSHEDKSGPTLAQGKDLHQESLSLENNLSQLKDITKRKVDMN